MHITHSWVERVSFLLCRERHSQWLLDLCLTKYLTASLNSRHLQYYINYKHIAFDLLFTVYNLHLTSNKMSLIAQTMKRSIVRFANTQTGWWVRSQTCPSMQTRRDCFQSECYFRDPHDKMWCRVKGDCQCRPKS